MTPLALLVPLPLKIVVDNIFGSVPLPTYLALFVPDAVEDSKTALIILAVALVLGIAAAMQLQQMLSMWLRSYIGERLVLELRARLFQYMQRLSIAYHDLKGTGDSSYRIQYDAICIRSFTIDGVLVLLTSVLTFAGMVCVTAYLDWQLALVAMLVSPVFYTVTRIYQGRLRSQWRAAKQLESDAMSVVQESLSAVRVVRAFGQEEQEHDRFLSCSTKTLAANLRLHLAQGWYSLLIGLTTALGTATVLFIGIRHVDSGALSLGALLVVMSYLAQLYTPLRTVGEKVTNLQNAFASAERVFRLLEEKPDVDERPNARALVRARGEFVFDGVSFAYEPEQRVLQDISFHLPEGTRLGIIGSTGSGKTTLTSLMLRFFDPVEGAILLDGTDLRDYQLADLRKQFAVVLQDAVLFSSTIAENISYARPAASFEQIVAAAKAANAHEFIMRLPQGYDTRVGERGMRLSGGERQRISLARAFLKDAPILILDEPTSSLDMHTETAVMEAIERLMRGRTTIMIAHRLTTLKNCDMLLTLENARVTDLSTDVRSIIREQLGVAWITSQPPDTDAEVSSGKKTVLG